MSEQEIVDFTKAEFGKYPEDQQAKMYAVILFVACAKWPEHAERFKAAYRRQWIG